MGAFSFFGQPAEEREAAIDQMEDEARHAKALADGYKDESCASCNRFFAAHVHFIRCDASLCPMRSTKDPRSLLDRFRDGT